MGAGRWVFGLGGELTWWYIPLIAVPFVLLQFATLWRMRVAEDRGRAPGRSVYVATAIAWLCALGFGITAPDLVNGEWVTILSHFAGDTWTGMSIALCNPFGIIAFAGIIAALIFAIAAGRDPRPSEDELIGDGEIAMVDHPLR